MFIYQCGFRFYIEIKHLETTICQVLVYITKENLQLPENAT